MPLVDDTRFFENITAAGQLDIGLPVRGGILLSVTATWHPYTFTNVGTADEDVIGANVEVIVGSSGGSSITSANPLQWNVVPEGGVWEWRHPLEDELKAAAAMVEKLSPGNLTPKALGLIGDGESLRYLYRPDPVRTTGFHSLEIHSTMLAFDLLSA